MKQLYVLLLSLIISAPVLGQVDEADLVGTWYVWALAQDLDVNIEVDDVTPSIAPTITINEDLTFEGICACNTFSGRFVGEPTSEYEIVDFVRTEGPCSSESQDEFEGYFFQYLPEDGFSQMYHFELFEGDPTQGEVLFINENPGFAFLCQSEPLLSVDELTKPTISVYPNPTSAQFTISKQIPSDAKITIYSISGQSQNLEYQANGVYDISSLANGLYVISIVSEQGSEQFKLVKQ